MSILRIYCPNHTLQPGMMTLDTKASHHVLHVLRLRPSQPLILFNGRGGEYLAKLAKIEQKSAIIEVKSYQDPARESCLDITLGQAISRGDRMDYTIQKAVELGVKHIVPLFSERCTVKLPNDRLQKKQHHWQNVIISACEQSGRCFIPKLSAPQPLHEWLKHPFPGRKWVCDPDATASLKAQPSPDTTQPMTLLIGPEGGLTPAEIDLAHQVGFLSLSLGPRILRTETAAIVAITLLQSRWGDID